MQIERITGRIGARVTGVDVSKPLDRGIIAAIQDAWNRHGVLFFPGQPLLSRDQHVAFVSQFGPVHIADFVTDPEKPETIVFDQTRPKGEGSDAWHSDSTYLPAPPRAGALQARILPDVGGDTCFASMADAYEGLSPVMQRIVEGLTATHSTAFGVRKDNFKDTDMKVMATIESRPASSHPVVVVHPVTGRKALFVNAVWTSHIDGLSKVESSAILNVLLDHIKSPEYQMRHRWSVGDLAFWDNHAVQHYAVPDYDTRRVMQSVRMDGPPPVGVRPLGTPAERMHQPAVAVVA
jgi:taurine dioxygenase